MSSLCCVSVVCFSSSPSGGTALESSLLSQAQWCLELNANIGMLSGPVNINLQKMTGIISFANVEYMATQKSKQPMTNQIRCTVSKSPYYETSQRTLISN